MALENRFYGYRRVAAELRRQGVVVNHKRVLRVMREDNLLSLRKRRFVVTTDSRHYRPIYPNLLAGRELTAPNQAWVADITYLRLREEFIFLAVVLDAFSRRVVGWELGESLQASLVLAALNRALAERPVPPGIIHHSDQGVQYASAELVDRLLECGFLISMSRKAAPWENGARGKLHEDPQGRGSVPAAVPQPGEARRSIGHFLEEVYNQRRLHSALGYLPPARIRARLARSKQQGGRCAAASLMSFFRHEEIYPCGEGDGGEGAILAGPRPRSSQR